MVLHRPIETTPTLREKPPPNKWKQIPDSPRRYTSAPAGGRREICTSVHRFAQRFEQNLIDGANGNLYLARQIEPGSLRTLRINLRGAASLTAVAPRD